MKNQNERQRGNTYSEYYIYIVRARISIYYIDKYLSFPPFLESSLVYSPPKDSAHLKDMNKYNNVLT